MKAPLLLTLIRTPFSNEHQYDGEPAQTVQRSHHKTSKKYCFGNFSPSTLRQAENFMNSEANIVMIFEK